MTTAEEQVGSAWHQQNAAMLAGDTGRLDELLADDYVARHITGYEQPKAEWLAQIRDGTFDYHSIDEHSLEIRAVGETATVVSEATVTVTIGGSGSRWPLRSTASYEKRHGAWLAVHSSSALA